MATLAALILQARILAADTAASNLIRGETPGGLNDGSNTKFRTQQRNLVAAKLYVTFNSTYRTQSGVTIDSAPDGLFTVSPAPAANANPFYIDYNFQWFTDAEYTEFLDDASRDLLANGDPTTVQDGLVAALLQYSLGYFYQRRATYYADRYSSTGGFAGQNVDVVTKNFQSLADAAFKRATTMRDDFYKRLGQREAPASAIINYKIDPITPRH